MKELLSDLESSAHGLPATTTASSSADAPAKMQAAIDERAAIERAIAIAQQRLFEARRDQITQLVQEYEGDWSENVRQIALTLAMLEKLCGKREHLRNLFEGENLACAGPHVNKLLTPGQREFIANAVKAGFVSEKELAG